MKKSVQRIVLSIGNIALLFLFVYVIPFPPYSPLVSIHQTRSGEDYTGKSEYPFHLNRFEPQFYLRAKGQFPDDAVSFSLYGDGDALMVQWTMKNMAFAFSVGNGFAPGNYKILVEENHALGSYSIVLYPKPLFLRHQKFMILITIYLLIGVISFIYLHIKQPNSTSFRRVKFTLFFIVLAFFSPFVYLIFHEGGHALGAMMFGLFDFSHSDIFGFKSIPHVQFKTDNVVLAPWKQAVISFGGPFLPNLAGYFLFWAWTRSRSKKWREQKPLLDIAWSFYIFLLLFAQLGALIPILRIQTDRDYSTFVNNVPWPQWTSDALLIMLIIINLWIIKLVMIHWWKRIMQYRIELIT